MIMTGRLRLEASLGAVLIKANGTRINLGDLNARKPWCQRVWEYLCFDQRGLVTDAGLNFLAVAFTVDAAGTDIFNMKFHDSGTGVTAAVQTDTTLQTQAGPTTRATASSVTQTQSASGTGSTTPAIITNVGTIAYVSSLAITEWGLFSQAAQGGTMWDHRVFSAINVISGDSIQYTYALSLPGGGT
jgi:hypothetical protein